MIINKEAEDNGTNYVPKEIYLGKVAYKVVGVNPNKEELKALNQFVPEEEPVYTGKREIDGKEYDLANITIYLQNVSNFDIIDRVTYTVVNNVQESQTGKLKVINKYGSEAWLEKSYLDSKTMPSNMEWFVNEGIKTALRGEFELVTFIRALRNFKNITMKSTQEDKDNYVSLFEEEDLNKLFKGDFKGIKGVLMSNLEAKVGFLLGARDKEGKTFQDIYKEYPLRSYMVSNSKSDEYIVKKVQESIDGGRYANTYFDLDNLSYKKYDESMKVQPDSNGNAPEEDDNSLPF